MRTVATGFILGIAVTVFLIAPFLACASGAARDYPGGVFIVLDRTGMLELLQRGARQAVEFSDHAMSAVDDFLNHQVVPLLMSQKS
ncbi:MAG TPA: hypothetical protein VL614_30145 [Acetobacteraceae bacterium]|jgi:hypothetical protein|nr:hypothetical protein [Acetobacteraceae bacterium]